MISLAQIQDLTRFFIYKNSTAPGKAEALFMKVLERTKVISKDEKATIIKDVKSGQVTLRMWGIQSIAHVGGGDNRPKLINEEKTYEFGINTLTSGTIHDGYYWVPNCIRINLAEVGEVGKERSASDLLAADYGNLNKFPQFLRGLLYFGVEGEELFVRTPLTIFDTNEYEERENEVQLQNSILIPGKRILHSQVEMQKADKIPENVYACTTLTGMCAMYT